MDHQDPMVGIHVHGDQVQVYQITPGGPEKLDLDTETRLLAAIAWWKVVRRSPTQGGVVIPQLEAAVDKLQVLVPKLEELMARTEKTLEALKKASAETKPTPVPRGQ